MSTPTLIFRHHPFGMVMPSRKWEAGSAEEYGFGFNGVLRDDEIKGENGSLDFAARIYDARLGRWLSIDPMAYKYPHESPYLFCSSNPIIYVDIDGLEKKIIHIFVDKKTGEKVVMEATTTNDLLMEETSVPPTGIGSEHSQNVIHYAYYDFSVTYTHYIEDGKEISVEKGDPVKGEKRGETAFPAEKLKEIEFGTKEWGGINWTSYDGQGQETKKGTIDVKQEDISLLLAAIGASKSAGGDVPESIEEYIYFGIEGSGVLFSIIESTATKDESNGNLDYYKCNYQGCGDTIVVQQGDSLTKEQTDGHTGPITKIDPPK